MSKVVAGLEGESYAERSRGGGGLSKRPGRRENLPRIILPLSQRRFSTFSRPMELVLTEVSSTARSSGLSVRTSFIFFGRIEAHTIVLYRLARDLQGSSIPFCYGFHSFNLPSQETAIGVVLEDLVTAGRALDLDAHLAREAKGKRLSLDTISELVSLLALIASKRCVLTLAAYRRMRRLGSSTICTKPVSRASLEAFRTCPSFDRCRL